MSLRLVIAFGLPYRSLICLFVLQVMLTPPLFRAQPHWYNKGLSEVAVRFSSTFPVVGRPPNLHILPSFSCQDLMPDGIFLTPVSGLHYVIHIFDQACSILDLAPMDAEVKISSVQEAVRHHDDRLAYLENRHGSLSTHHDLKQAAHAEFSDWMLNKSEEDWVTITGLPRLSCGRREWPDAARKQVNKLVQQVLDINQTNLEGRILFVNNPIPHRTTGMTVYNVQLSSLEAAKGLRGLFSGFFKRKRVTKYSFIFVSG